MKKYILFIFAGAIILSVFAFTSNSQTKEDKEIQQYDQKIENLQREIEVLNKQGEQKAAILDNLLNTI